MGTNHAFWKTLIAVMVLAAPGMGEAKDMTPFMFPTAPLFTSTLGPVFPGPGATGVANAAALTTNPPQHTLTFINSVGLAGGDDDFGVNVGYSWSNEKIGISGGYSGIVSGTKQHGYFGGASLKVGKVSTGIAAYQAPGSTGSPVIDVSFAAPLLRKSVIVTALLRDSLNNAKPVIGGGQRFDKFQWEIWFDLPPFKDLPAGYAVGGAMTFGLGSASVHTGTLYQTVSGEVTYTFGLGMWAGDDAHISIQYDSNNRINAGVSMPL